MQVSRTDKIIAIAIVAGFIFFGAIVNKYDYLALGSTGFVTFKNGEIQKICDLSLDRCFIRRGEDFSTEKLGLKQLVEQANSR